MLFYTKASAGVHFLLGPDLLWATSGVGRDTNPSTVCGLTLFVPANGSDGFCDAFLSRRFFSAVMANCRDDKLPLIYYQTKFLISVGLCCLWCDSLFTTCYLVFSSQIGRREYTVLRSEFPIWNCRRFLDSKSISLTSQRKLGNPHGLNDRLGCFDQKISLTTFRVINLDFCHNITGVVPKDLTTSTPESPSICLKLFLNYNNINWKICEGKKKVGRNGP